MLQDGKKKKKVSLHMHDTLKTICEKNLNKKKKKPPFTGVRTHINENDDSWIIYNNLKNGRATYCAIESFDN